MPDGDGADERLARIISEAVRDQVSAALAADRVAAKPAPSAITFHEGFEQYGESVPFARYRNLRSLLKPVIAHFGKRPIAELRRSDWPRYLENIRSKQRTRQGVAPAISTMNRELTESRAVLNFLVNLEVIPFNVWQGIPKKKGGHRRETVVTEDKLDMALQDACDLAHTFVTVIFWTGMRSTEARLMEWQDIDWENGRIWIPKDRVKTKSSRWAPMPHQARSVLEGQPHHVTSPHVFANPKTPNGKPYTRCYLWMMARTVLDKLDAAPGDGNVHPHDSRHSLVTRLAQSGVNVMTAMKLVGHTSAAEHWRYHHLTPKEVDAARVLLEKGGRRPPRRAPATRRGATRQTMSR